ncbi:hypothetical protein D9M73_153680 [compost metagenome]
MSRRQSMVSGNMPGLPTCWCRSTPSVRTGGWSPLMRGAIWGRSCLSKGDIGMGLPLLRWPARDLRTQAKRHPGTAIAWPIWSTRKTGLPTPNSCWAMCARPMSSARPPRRYCTPNSQAIRPIALWKRRCMRPISLWRGGRLTLASWTRVQPYWGGHERGLPSLSPLIPATQCGWRMRRLRISMRSTLRSPGEMLPARGWRMTWPGNGLPGYGRLAEPRGAGSH